ncbi:hypothetical protein V5735_23730 (plasmid) [Haladaptatus sp. SPP-AMP-3]|uniref:hypothetical protein n=1 Tax=Haladaptatus sp. SPP-AMP-3 TaxID=3121295 RepID=UPI003C2EBBB5
MVTRDNDDATSTGRRRFLAGGIGLAASTVVIGRTTPVAEAHFPPELDIDVEPGTDTNPVSPGTDGYVLVAVHSTEAFDPTEKAVRYRFGTPERIDAGNGARPAFGGTETAIGGDGATDLLLHFPVAKTGFGACTNPGQTAKLVWERDEHGEHGYSGTDDVTVGKFNPVQHQQSKDKSRKADSEKEDSDDVSGSNGRSEQAEDDC